MIHCRRIALLLSAGAVAAVLSTGIANAQTVVASARTITVTGEAERKVVPDEAHVNVGVSALANTVQAAKAEHDKKLTRVLEIAKAAGIDEAQIKTDASRIEPQYSYDNNKRQFKGYRMVTTLDVTVKKTAALGGLLENLTSADLESKSEQDYQELVNVYYTISSPEKIRDEMVVTAIGNAHDKAARMASAAGATLGAVYQLTEGSVPNFTMQPRPMPMMAMVKAAAAPVAPPAGEQQVNATVTVTYELK